MSETKDDPREVLVLLNSLGFVGITATQLKAFLKDLKIYRKIKEREKQQRKEEIKTKIISKQQALIKEAHEYQNIDFSLINLPSESSNSNDDESLIKVRIKCIPKISKKEIQKDIQKHTTATVIKSDEKLSTIKYCKEDIQVVKSGDDYLSKKYKLNLRVEDQAKPITSVYEQSVCKPKLSNVCGLESKSIALDPTENVYTQNILSSRSSINSRQKSFIRPWRLQPQAQKVIDKKCDPVALYQMYQQKWKQMPFPGEAKHSKVRWAIREKMLGTDPHPMPLLKKSTSTSMLKKK